MSEKLTDIKCCSEPVFIERNAVNDNKDTGIGVWCDKCGINAFHEDEKTAVNLIKEQIKNKPVEKQQELDITPKNKKPPAKKQQTALTIIPHNPAEVEKYFVNNQNHIISITSPIIGDESAMLRLINNTMRYVQNLKGDSWDKIWATPEGQESIIYGTEEAMMMGAELGKMGDLVPFGKICQFIASVEAYEFSLTNGKNAPFEWIKIECVYVGDDIRSGRKTGDFFLDFEKFGERIKVESVYVYGLNKKSKHVEGDVYAAQRLLEKAAEHSQPYKNYLKIMKAFDFAVSEGRNNTDPNGRKFFTYYTIKDVSTDKYFQKSVDNFYAQETAGKLKKDSKGEYAVEVIPKGTNGPWEKKLYRSELEGGKEEKIIFIDDLTNPYAGSDQPEMLRQGAGKSFLRKYGKVRNSEAAMDEVRTNEKMVERAFDLADEVME